MIRWIAVVASTIVLSLEGSAACLLPLPRLVCAEYFRNQVVVEATLVSSEYIEPENGMPGHFYQMKTDKVLRGNLGEEFKIWEENSSGRAGFAWQRERPYLLFLTQSDDKHGAWELDGCGNSGPLKQAVAALNSIQQISRAQSGLIQVGVGGLGADSKNPLAGRHVTAEGSGPVFTGTSDNRGIADIKVPPGTYKVTVSDSGRFEPYDLSYDDPRSVVVQKGGCAQIQFGAGQ